MISSTSSSERSLQWLHTWSLALVLCGSMLAALEVAARWCGFTPLIRNTPDLWRVRRTNVRQAGADAITFVGASRMTHAIDLDVASRWRPHARPIQLGVEGMGVLPIVEDLADDPAVLGTVVVSWAPILLEPEPSDRARAYVDHFHAEEHRIGRRWEPSLDAALEQRFVVFRSEFALKHVLVHAWSHQRLPPLPQASVLERDGSQPLPRATLATRTVGLVGVDNVTRWVGHRIAHRVSWIDWMNGCERLVVATDRMLDRGMHVHIVRMPSSGPFAATEEELYPRAAYWDACVDLATHRLGHRPAWSMRHYADDPALRRFDTPDGSHIAAEDRAAFTQALGRAQTSAWTNLIESAHGL